MPLHNSRNLCCLQATSPKCETKADNSMWGQSRKYKRKQKLKILAAHHVVRGGRMHPHIMWPASIFIVASACVFCFGPILHFVLWPHIIVYLWASWAQKSMAVQLPCELGPSCWGAFCDNVFSSKGRQKASETIF